MNNKRFRHLMADFMHWIQGGHRPLKDHANVTPAQTTHLPFTKLKQVLCFEPNMPRYVCALGQKPHCGKGSHRFTRTTFPNQPKDFPPLD